jgi:DNA repair protein RadC
MAIVDSTTTSSSGARAPSPTRPAPFGINARHLIPLGRLNGIENTKPGHTPLYVRKGDAFYEAPASQILLQAQELIDQQFRSRCSIPSNPQLMRVFLKVYLAGRGHEVFAALFLDARQRLIEYVELFRGTIDGADVYSREVVKEALARNAAAVIFVHNHPSGVAEPSFADELLTKKLEAALDLVGVKVLDHMIVGESITSFAELGLL